MITRAHCKVMTPDVELAHIRLAYRLDTYEIQLHLLNGHGCPRDDEASAQELAIRHQRIHERHR